MRDLVFIATTVGFFSVSALVVAVCDRIVGPDPVDLEKGGRVASPGAEPVSR